MTGTDYDVESALTETGDDSDAIDLAALPDTISFGPEDHSDAIDITRGPRPDSSQSWDDPEIVDITSQTSFAETAAADEVVDLAREPDILRIKEETAVKDQEIVRIDEAHEPQTGIGEWVREAPESIMPEQDSPNWKAKILGPVSRIKEIALLPLVKIKGILKKEPEPAVDPEAGLLPVSEPEEPGAVLPAIPEVPEPVPPAGPVETRKKFKIPSKVAKALPVAFIVICLAVGGLLGFKISNIYSSRVNQQQAEPSAEAEKPSVQNPPEKTTKNERLSDSPKKEETLEPAPSKVEAPVHPTTQPPDHPTVQNPTRPASQLPVSSGGPSLINIPDKGKYDEPPYSKDVYQKGLQ